MYNLYKYIKQYLTVLQQWHPKESETFCFHIIYTNTLVKENACILQKYNYERTQVKSPPPKYVANINSIAKFWLEPVNLSKSGIWLANLAGGYQVQESDVKDELSQS